jgi:hypothetical protein
MQGNEFIGRYRSYAAKCIAISRNISDPAGKLILLEMAQGWLTLAERAAREAEAGVIHQPAAPAVPQCE